MRLILASASPRRADLLRAAGFEFQTCAADVDERVVADESPAAYVRRLAAQKSAAVQAVLKGCATGVQTPGAAKSSTEHTSRTPTTTIMPTVAPTPVAQPPSRDARSGEPRRSESGGGAFRPASDIVVLGADTAVVVDGAILGKPRSDEEAAAMLRRLSARRHEVMTGISLRAGPREIGRVETTAVHVARLGEEEIAWYVRSAEGRDKAGAYAIQGLASRFIFRIEGSYSNVVGLPVAAVWELMRTFPQLGSDASVAR
jgi:septum formation protein